MGPYILKRVLLFIPTLFGVITLNFFLAQLLPGGPVESLLKERVSSSRFEQTLTGNPAIFALQTLSHEHIEDELRHRFGFDKPWWKRYGNEIVRLLSFQFGESYFYDVDIGHLFLERLPVSVSLGFLVFLVTYMLAVPLGVFWATCTHRVVDTILGLLVVCSHTLPTLILGAFLLMLFGGGSFWNLFPTGGLYSENFAELSLGGKILDYLHHLFLPLVCISAGHLAQMMTMMRSSISEHLQSDYVRTARVKGLSEWEIIGKHVLRNVATYLLTDFGTRFLGVFFRALLVIETLFSLNGFGLLTYESIVHRDYPVVLAIFYLFSLVYILGNLITDLLYMLVDPRISENLQESSRSEGV